MSKPTIRPIAICLIRHGDKILVSESHDTAKGDQYCRPLGGGIEFGETSRDAVIRELREEIGAEIVHVRHRATLENIFTVNGKPGHEIVFVYEADLADAALYERPAIAAYEQGIDERFEAVWLSLAELAPGSGRVRLVPEGLHDLL